jgi:hypothetical protein
MKVKLSVGKREELREKMLKFRAEAEEGNRSTFERMTENERFKIGLQWNSDDTSFNEAHGKFSLTINEILPIVLDIAGTQEENPLDYKVRNVKGGTQTIAEILTALAKHVMSRSHGKEESSRAFESGITTARGYIHIDIEYGQDPMNGDFVIKEPDPFMVLPDPTCRTYDYNADKNGAKYIWIDDWEDKDKVEARYPGHKEEIKAANYNPIPQGRFGAIMSSMFGGQGPNLNLKDDYRHFDEKEESTSNTTKQQNNYRVSCCWWKEWKKGVYVQKTDDPLSYIAITKPSDISYAKEQAESNPNIKIVDKDNEGNPLVVALLNKTTMIGDIIVEHNEDPYNGMNMFLTTRFAPYFDHGYEYPPVQNLTGPQKLINYTFSSLVNILKNLSNSGWKVGKAGQRWIEWLEEHGGEDGLVLPLDKFGGSAEKIATTDYPTGFDVITERGKQNMREISQVQLEVPTKRAESGRALAIKEQQSIKTKGIIFRNWNQTNQMIAKTLIELIRNTQVFSDEEILAIIDEEDLIDEKILDHAKGIVLNQLKERGVNIPEPPKAPNPIRVRNAEPEHQAQILDTYQEEAALYKSFVQQVEQTAIPLAQEIMLNLVRNMQSGRYGIEVDTSPMAPTMRMAQRFETLELDRQLLEGGRPGISRKKLIEISDIQDKEEIIAEEQQPVQGAA